MARWIFLVVIIIGLFGCTPWPKHSTGGYASHYLFTPSYQKSLFKSNYPYIYSQQLYKLNKQAMLLSHSHAQKCYPARFRLLHRLGEQIAQEIDSGMLYAAKSDLILYQSNLEAIRKLNKNRGCPRPKKDPAWEFIKLRDQ
jgi:hypothetical protein